MPKALDLSISLDDKELDQALSAAIKAGDDLTRPMAEIADEWMAAVHQRFADQKDPMGVPWAKRRDDSDPERPILHLTGDMERAVIPDYGPDYAAVGVLQTAGPGRYARIHNEGGVILPRKAKALSFGGRIVAKVVMPKREYIGFGTVERTTAIDVLTDFVGALFGGAK